MSVTLEGTSPEELIEPGLRAAVPPSRAAWRRLLRNPTAVISLSVLAFLIVASIVVPMIRPYSYTVATDDIFAPVSSSHWLGTDDSGYDILVRVAVGARISLGIGFAVESVVLLVGLSVGLLAGYYGKWADTALMRFTDMMFAFPDILLAILIMAVLAQRSSTPILGLANVFASLSVTGWPSIARLVRGQTLSLRHREYVEAARALGVPDNQIILGHIFPNLLSSVIIFATTDIAGVIVAESTLSFLGIGVPPPLPSWGSLIASPLESGYFQGHPQLVLYPALCLSATVLAFNFLGDALRDALDPRSQ